jgi:hypothetical protein
MRLRGQVADLVEGSELQHEFEATFPAIDLAKQPTSHQLGEIGLALEQGKFPARQAQSLLAQLAGWIGGLVREATLEKQMRFNAEAYAKEARKGPVGFHPGDEKDPQ